MPTVAETYRAKRLLTDLSFIGGASEAAKRRRRVRFDDDRSSLENELSEGGEKSEVRMEEEEGEGLDFALTIGPDGEWGYTIEGEDDGGEGGDVTSSRGHSKTSRSSSPYAGCGMSPCDEEIYTSSSYPEDVIEAEERAEERSASSADGDVSLGDDPWMHVDYEATESSLSDPVVPMMPLITPPSSPRTIRALSIDGETMELTTICEWPSNLTVDNAITAALELVPYDAAVVKTRRMSSFGP